MIDDNEIGEQLRTLRKYKGLTTQQLAGIINISQSYISRFENGRSIPDIDRLKRILKPLDSDLSSFFSSDLQDLPEDLKLLFNMVKMLSPEARIKLNQFLKLMQEQ